MANLKEIKNSLIKFDGRLWSILKSIRPRQWLKNFALFAPALFSGQLFEPKILNRLLLGFVLYSLASSGAYLFNDVIDAKKDRSHPFKKLRPIAAGKISAKLALTLSFTLSSSALYLAYLTSNRFFFLSLVFFILLQFAYSLFFRNQIIIDALLVALTFLTRVFAGSFVIGASISSWLILSTVGVSLLLAFGKRRSERTLLASGDARFQSTPHPTRTTLLHYPDTLLDSMISVSASFTIISYSLFSFQISPRNPNSFLTFLLPPTLSAPKWMMLTIPFVIYGVARYLYVIYEKKEGESPERVLISDLPLLFTIISWTVVTVMIIYFLGS